MLHASPMRVRTDLQYLLMTPERPGAVKAGEGLSIVSFLDNLQMQLWPQRNGCSRRMHVTVCMH